MANFSLTAKQSNLSKKLEKPNLGKNEIIFNFIYIK